MNLVFEKNMRIMIDLIDYCHIRGSKKFRTDMEVCDGYTFYIIESCFEEGIYPEQEVEKLNTILNVPRQIEVETSWSSLSGDVDTFPQLDLIGMMIDEAQVTFQDNVLRITVKRLDAHNF